LWALFQGVRIQARWKIVQEVNWRVKAWRASRLNSEFAVISQVIKNLPQTLPESTFMFVSELEFDHLLPEVGATGVELLMPAKKSQAGMRHPAIADFPPARAAIS
jgi:hypothetical protein